MAFKYRKRDPSDLEKRATQQGSDFVGIFMDEYPVYKVRNGENAIRILPPTWDNPDHYGFEVYTHRGVGPDNALVLCLNKMEGKRCPGCEEKARAEKAGDEELVKEFKPQKRLICWVIDRKEEDKSKRVPQLFNMAWTLDRDIVKISKDRRSGEFFAIDDPDDGYDVYFDKTGEKITTKYGAPSLDRNPSPAEPKGTEGWLDFVEENPIPGCLVFRTYEEIAALYAGGEDSDEPPARGRREPEDDPPPRRRTIPREDAEEPRETRANVRPTGRARDAVDDDEIPGLEPPTRRSQTREPAAEDDPPPRRRTIPREPEPEEEPAPRRRVIAGARPDPIEEDEIPFDPPARTVKRDPDPAERSTGKALSPGAQRAAALAERFKNKAR